MTTVIIANFMGMQPLVDASLLPDSNAQYSENTWLYRGLIRGFRHATLAHQNKYGDTQHVYRIPLNNYNPPDFTDAGSLWLEQPDPYMAVVRNPTINDQYLRYYFFPSDQYNSQGNNPSWPAGGAGTVPPQYNTFARIQAGLPAYTLGIPVPISAPVIVPATTAITTTATSPTVPGNAVLNVASATGVLAGMYVADTTITTTSAVTTAATAINSTVLTFGSTTGILVGMQAQDITNPGAILSGTTVATVSSSTTAPAVSAVATAATAVGGTVLTLSSTTNVVVGMVVQDATNASAIPSNTTVTAVTPTTVTLSAAVVASGVSNGDTINFVNQSSITIYTVTLNTVVLSPGVSSGDTIHFVNQNQIPTNAAVSSVSGLQVTMNVKVAYAGVLTGDQLIFSTSEPETRAYVYTYVSTYGEEGPPSPADVQTGDPTGVWTVTVYNPTAAQMQNRSLAYIRIYRTVVDSSGNASYYQVTQLPISGAPGAAQVYTDDALPSAITANQQLSTVDYTAPPSDLQGVVMMANGIAAGWSNSREVWFSAAYQLHAWPAAYALSVEYPIVGLTANGSSLNVMMEGPPTIISGVTPGTMTVARIAANEPCISRGSIAASQEGAYYASPNGVLILAPSGVTLLTQGIYEKEFHFRLQPWYWAAGRYGTSYVSFVKGVGLAGIDPDGDLLHGFVVDNQNANVSFSFLNFKNNIVNLYQDELSGQLFGTLSNGTVMQWNPPVGNPGTTTLWGWEWRSKKFRFTAPQQFKAFLVYFDIPPEVTIALGPRNTDPNQVYNQATQYMIVQIYADGMLLTTREVQVSGEVLLLNQGSKWTYWEIRIQGQVQVRMFKMASSVKELKAA
jgi:hypothetical protein